MTLESALASFGLTADAELGRGGEARVFALDAARVLRIGHEGSSLADAQRRAVLLKRLGHNRNRVSFALPAPVETGIRADRVYTIESRIPGGPLDKVLAGATGNLRRALIEGYFAAADEIRLLGTSDRFEELGYEPPLSDGDYRTFLRALVDRSTGWAGIALDSDAIIAALPDCTTPELTHLDYFPGNVMTDGRRITGVLDFGYASIMADSRLTPLVAALSLDKRMFGKSHPADANTIAACLQARALADFLPAARRFLAAYWVFASRDDPNLAAWARPELGL